MSGSEALYRRLPPWMQTMALNGHAARLYLRRQGGEFRRRVEAWEASQWWSREQMREWQDRRIRDIVRYAYERVPYYRHRWDELGIGPRDVRGVEDLARLPVLEKTDVRKAGKDLTPADENVDLFHGHTSGTTGSPLSLWYDRTMEIVNTVADWRQKSWGGMEPGDWHGLFLGRVVVPTDQTDPPFWRTNFVHRQVWFSSFHMSPENLDHYVAQIRRRGLRHLEGYPSTLFILARHVLGQGETLPMTSVFTSSETLHGFQRETIAEAFECEVFDFYGLAERVVFAGECERHDGKHLFEEYGVTEIVDDDGRPVPDGETGWLTGTTLWNRGMPLIRYRTSDLSWTRDACDCGRGLGRIASVTTKAEDVVVTPDGRFVSPSVLTHPFKPFDEIKKSQIIQEDRDHLRIRLVTDQGFTEEMEEGLRASLRDRVGGEMRLDVEYPEAIPPEPSGKFRWVISRVPHSCQVSWDELDARGAGGGEAGALAGPSNDGSSDTEARETR